MLKYGVNTTNDVNVAYDEIEPYIDWFDNSVTKGIKDGDSYNGATFYLYGNKDGECVGVAIVGYKPDDDIYDTDGNDYLQAVPFFWELGTCVNNPDKKEKGVSYKIIEAVIDDFGNEGFWGKALDDDAWSFWQHFAKKNNFPIDIVGETAWGTPIFDIDTQKQ